MLLQIRAQNYIDTLAPAFRKIDNYRMADVVRSGHGIGVARSVTIVHETEAGEEKGRVILNLETMSDTVRSAR